MKKKYKIAINVSPLSNGNSVRGVGYYTKNIVEFVQKETTTNPAYSDFEIKLITENSQLTNDFDLVHYPYFDPFFLTLPISNKPFIVSVHDLIPIEFSSHYPVGIKGRIKWLIQKYALKKSKYIITDSHYSKYVISKYIGYPVDKIYTTLLASSSEFKPIKNQKLLQSIRKKYKLPRKFVMYIGDIDWNKNIPTLVKACQSLKYPLVIVGSSATKTTPLHPWTKDIHWLQSIVKTQKKPLIYTLGFVPDEDMAPLLSLATIYCQPSFAEGFGLPPLHAMQSGCPVVYSQATSLPEVVDYSGIPFDPENQLELEKNLKLLWDNKKLRKEYSQKGLKRASTFSWRQTALSTLAVYRLALLDEKK